MEEASREEVAQAGQHRPTVGSCLGQREGMGGKLGAEVQMIPTGLARPPPPNGFAGNYVETQPHWVRGVEGIGREETGRMWRLEHESGLTSGPRLWRSQDMSFVDSS